MPVRLLLEIMGRLEELCFSEMRADQLQAYRESAGEPARYRERRQTGEISSDGIDVIEVHLNRIIHLLADAKGRGRGRRADHEIHGGECAGEVVADQLPNLLRLKILVIVVTGGQHIRPRQYPSLDFWAETLAARAHIQFSQVVKLLGTMPVAHAVEAGKIR